MILKIIMNIAITIIGVLFKLISVFTPNMQFTMYISTFLDLIKNTLQTSINFIYFLIGDAMYPFLMFGIAMLGYRYLLFPTISILRRIFIHGGDT